MKKVVVIGDTHWKPKLSSKNMAWIGRYVAEAKPDRVVHIGDAFDMESCEMHSPPGSRANSNKSTFQDDIASGEDALDIYHREIGCGQIRHDIVLGNHEYRAWRTEELHPSLDRTLTGQIKETFTSRGWSVTPYRHWLMIKRVGFTHVPQTIMQRPFGGKNSEIQIGNSATHSVVFGHTHRQAHITVPKVGIQPHITVTNVGSAMPHGYTPHYTDGAMTGYTWGIADLTIDEGVVQSASFISMIDLKDRYQ